jgi:hypothetical protein
MAHASTAEVPLFVVKVVLQAKEQNENTVIPQLVL